LPTNCNDDQINSSCPVPSNQRSQLSDVPVETSELFHPAVIKAPVVLAETTLQIVTDATIQLNKATEIKRVLKNVFLTQCKLVPVAFRDREDTPGIREVIRAKLLVEGFVRKNIEYSTATSHCTGQINFTNADVPFSGFVDLSCDDFDSFPILRASSQSRSLFIDPKNGNTPQTDKFFFENSVFFNEQPFCELVAADFFELDFSPIRVGPNQSFNSVREKMVLDLTLKVLQVQQFRLLAAKRVDPILPNPNPCPSDEDEDSDEDDK
jgi:hypothetical protein